MKKTKTSRLHSYLFLLLNVVVWGAALVIVKPAFAVTTPYRFLLYRFWWAALCSLPILAYYLPKIKKLKEAFFKITLLEVFGTGIALALLYLGLERTTAIEASLIATTTPIFVVLAGVYFLKEKETKREAIGLVIAFLGTLAMTIIPTIQKGDGFNTLSLSGNALIFVQNCVAALYYVSAKKYYKKLPKLFVTTISFYIGIIFFFFLSLWETSFSVTELTRMIISDHQHTSVWIASLYMAIFGSIIGLTAYIKGQDGIEASEASLFGYLSPLIYVPLGVLWLHETFSFEQMILLGVILAGVVLAEKR